MKKSHKGFTLVELLISVSLLAIVSLVSVNIITTLLKSSVKAQMAIDIEQASSFVFLKLENDIKKSYNAQVTGSTLILSQGSPVSSVTTTYKIASGVAEGCSDDSMNCILLNNTKLTDDTLVNGKPTLSAVSVDLANSSFSIVEDALHNPVAVNIKIKFFKPNSSNAKMFNAETTLDTTVVLRGSY